MANELRVVLTVFAVVIIAKLCGCAAEVQPPIDAGELDAGELDAGELDAGELDAGELDAGDTEPEQISIDVDCYGLGSTEAIEKVAVAYDDCDDKTAVLSATRIALLADFTIEVWDDWDYPGLDDVAEHLRTFAVISIHFDSATDIVPEFARLKFPELYAEDPEAAIEQTGDGDAFSFVAGKTNYIEMRAYPWFMVVASTILTEGWADIVLHEIMHAALWAAYSDPDPNHNRADIWLEHSDITVMSEVLNRYYNTY